MPPARREPARGCKLLSQLDIPAAALLHATPAHYNDGHTIFGVRAAELLVLQGFRVSRF